MRIIKNISLHVNFRTVINHSICWILLIIYELIVFSFTSGTLPSISVFLFYYCCNIGLFYCQVGLLTLTLSPTKRQYVKLFLFFIVEIIAFLSIKMIADFILTDFSRSAAPKLQVIKVMGTLDLLRNIYYIAFGTLYWTIKNINNFQKKADAAEIKSLKNAKEAADLEIKLAKARNAYLQQQINPHLLFNSLNFIHSSVYKLSHEAAENIILLSEIMRYSLEETDSDGKINLGNEAEQIEKLIKINQFRYDYPLDISYVTEGDLTLHKIIPLVLLTLTENLFKHGDLSGKSAVIRLSVTADGELKFYTSNHKRPQPPVKRIKSIGIKNIKIRLSYTYGTGYLLAVNDTDDLYESELTLRL